jgi:hypothetical protein
VNGFWKRWLAWALAALALAGIVVALVLAFDRGGPGTPEDWANLVGVVGFVVGFGAVGFILATRRPDHSIGWLMEGFSAVGAIRLACEGSLMSSGAGLTAWLVVAVNILGALQLALITAIAIAFPDGIPKQGPWRVAMWVVWSTVAIGVVTAPFSPYDTVVAGVQIGYPAPLGPSQAMSALVFLPMLALFGIITTALVRLVLLLFRGDPIQRHQIRWVAYSVALSFIVLTLDPLFPGRANVVAGVIAGVAVPLSIAVAITRHNLYDIDRVINRTVVYAIVMGSLAVLFAAGAVWIPSRLPFDNNNLSVAASTLAVFFLFNPLRKRVQRLVDHRFYRSRYDAQQVADEFSARLRDQVDPDVVTEEWVEVVQRTLEPESVAVWVQEPTIS